MKYKYISHENFNRSLMALLKIEDLNPSKEAINLTDLIIDGVTSNEKLLHKIAVNIR